VEAAVVVETVHCPLNSMPEISIAPDSLKQMEKTAQLHLLVQQDNMGPILNSSSSPATTPVAAAAAAAVAKAAEVVMLL